MFSFLKNKEKQGEVYIISSAILWGFFPIITILSYKSLTPLVSLAVSTFISSIFFGVLVWYRGSIYQIKDRQAMFDTLIMTLILGVGYYGLYFLALQYTSAGNASMIALTETLFSYLFFNVWRKEEIINQHIIGAVLMIVSAVLVLSSNFQQFKYGDILVLLASVITPAGNYYQRRARQRASSEVIWLIRSLIATPILLLAAYIAGERINLHSLEVSWLVLLINGLVIMGISKIFWLESIHRINIAKANALSVIAVVVTLLSAWLILNQTPTIWQVMALVPMIGGVILLGFSKKGVEVIEP
ncbi:MAG: DMT family transporter [Candidatus Kerfeldbacteria bacterium]|nr:DMT family transporter [Candidatus Kerfeldbacteria bacterium]